jgi:CRP/FNR family cyclic AMP-dependent transcriptional regulator
VSPESLLARVPFFSALSDQDIDALASRARHRTYAKGEIVFHRDDPGATLHIIERGSVRVVLASPEGEEITLAVLGEGDFFGDIALLDGGQRSATVIAAEPTETVAISREEFLRWFQDRPKAAVTILATVGQRLRATSELVGDVAFLNVLGRLAKRLLELSGGHGRATPESPIELRFTQEELASMIGVTRESVNKHLKFLKDRGAISVRRGRVSIRRPEELEKYL